MVAALPRGEDIGAGKQRRRARTDRHRKRSDWCRNEGAVHGSNQRSELNRTAQTAVPASAQIGALQSTVSPVQVVIAEGTGVQLPVKGELRVTINEHQREPLAAVTDHRRAI